MEGRSRLTSRCVLSFSLNLGKPWFSDRASTSFFNLGWGFEGSTHKSLSWKSPNMISLFSKWESSLVEDLSKSFGEVEKILADHHLSSTGPLVVRCFWQHFKNTLPLVRIILEHCCASYQKTIPEHDTRTLHQNITPDPHTRTLPAFGKSFKVIFLLFLVQMHCSWTESRLQFPAKLNRIWVKMIQKKIKDDIIWWSMQLQLTAKHNLRQFKTFLPD